MEEVQKGVRGVKGVKILAAMMIIFTLIVASGCSAASNENSKSNSSADLATTSKAEGSVASESKADSKSNTATESPEAAAGASFGASETDPSIADDAGMNRKLIYRSNVAMQVDDYAKAQTLLKNIIHLSGGYLLKFDDKKTSAELGGTYTIKVPSSGFDSFLTALEKLKGSSYESSIEGTDVTEEYVDLESRMKARQVVEARLLSFMEKAVKTDELLKISNELGDVQTEIERIKGRMRYLDKNVAYSTIELRMYQQTVTEVPVVKEEKTGFLQSLQNALSGSANVVYAFIQGVFIFIAGALPVLLLLVVIGIPVYWAYRSNRRGKSNIASKVQVDEKIAEREAQDSAEPTPPTDDDKL
ncbi:hypothetical protein Back11_25790 [Paenibacillus baekrokdamisoli]|uniref:DUF4349 domain-containing protein n=1 Tax=Paenibacillus baekrokdamisoli TaxID=1712516 RepID=A0A3G9JDJ9_9BACL|nr:DUF4349 domain-containing protein [Paenibacillus baekrokdamisoli]MBB3070229.1 hypothetical protein [Paenibacillus baekrokdamisoli]BBH21234.1 hypothetical protein Back11_25790 [Paenibacillus baekrokdamisoli]